MQSYLECHRNLRDVHATRANTIFPLMRFKPQETTNTPPRRLQRNRNDRNQNANLHRPSARQPQPSDKSSFITTENRGLNCVSGKVVPITNERLFSSCRNIQFFLTATHQFGSFAQCLRMLFIIHHWVACLKRTPYYQLPVTVASN